jgi:hypothetical protein
MPKNASARSNDYFLERLRLERPDVLRDLNSGKHATAAAAFRAANLKKLRTRLQEMKNAWSKASPAECDEFKTFIGCTTPAAGTPPVTAPFSTDRKLSPHVVTKIVAIMMRRSMSMGTMMDELGFNRLNPSLGLALSQNSRLQPDMITALEKWIAADLAAVKSS